MSITSIPIETTDPETAILRVNEIAELAKQAAITAGSIGVEYVSADRLDNLEAMGTKLAELGTEIAWLSQIVANATSLIAAENMVRPAGLRVGDRFADPTSVGEWLTVTGTPSPAFTSANKVMIPVDRHCDDLDADPYVIVSEHALVEVQA